MRLNNLSYIIKRSRRKTLSIYVEPTGEITVLAPENKTDAEINAVINSKKLQIYRKLAEISELKATQKVRELVSGESYLYLGRNYRLKFVDSQNVALKLSNGYFSLREKDRQSSQLVFKDYYRCKGLVKITERVKLYQSQMGVKFKNIQVMELQNRWGSYSRKTNNLCFHWKCMLTPIDVLDYIVVHELAHIKHPNHSAEFWNEVDKIMPDYQKRKDWLRYNGAGIGL
ncbi:MAG: M48 family metallopeptidase [Burkholderiales bacterium]|jgi:predicted metal-dependent hydrolase|nr:M48 family metallopeptidase [Burkholderiales bacterium]